MKSTEEKTFFIAIGPEKTGTTWLYNNLKAHPEINLNRVKEIRYLWENQYLGNSINLYSKLFKKHWHLRSNRVKLKGGVNSFLYYLIKKRKLKLKSLQWELRFFFGIHNRKWYKSLFNYNYVTGDITPKYAELNTNFIRELQLTVPDAKIIISLRDPVERHWSWLKMSLLQQRGLKKLNQVDKHKIKECINNKVILKSNDYVSLYKRWEEIYGEENILIIYFDELQNNPKSLLRKVESFLSISAYTYEANSTPVNKGLTLGIPKEIKEELVKNNKPYLEDMKYFFIDKYPEYWAEKHL